MLSRHRLMTALSSGVIANLIQPASLAFSVLLWITWSPPSRTSLNFMFKMSPRRWAVINAKSIAFCSQVGDLSRIAFRPSTVWRLRFFFSIFGIVLAAGLSGHRPLDAAWLKMSTNKARAWFAARGVRVSSNSAIWRMVI
ncbi:hypothetical protein D3C76_1127180 [compost metagenome]